MTFHSPDIYEDCVMSLSTNAYKVRTTGLVGFNSNVGDINIETETPPIGTNQGFVHKTTCTTASTYSDRRLCAGLFYYDNIVDDLNSKSDMSGAKTIPINYMVYPWHSSGSLNNDTVRSEGNGTRSAVLKRKIISNLKFSEQNISQAIKELSFSDNTKINMGIFNSNENTVLKV